MDPPAASGPAPPSPGPLPAGQAEQQPSAGTPTGMPIATPASATATVPTPPTPAGAPAAPTGATTSPAAAASAPPAPSATAAAPAGPAITIEITPDGMEGTVFVPAGATLPASAALDRMIRAGISAGILEGPLAELAVAADEDRRIVVARGTPAVQPVHARIEVLVDFAVRLNEDEGHHIDFREQGRFHEAVTGTALARLVPKVPGAPGRTVHGRGLPVPEARDADLSTVAGEGTRIDQAKGEVVAERDGLVVRRRDGHLDIMPSVEIPGDLDMRWGNLVTKLPVSIRGDVIAGFSIKGERTAEIKGVIEDARISVKGDLTCGGILPGKHRVKSHGDIATKHISGRTIKCRNLAVASDIRGSTVFAIGDIAAKLIVSSTVTCGGSVTCDELGHPDEHGGLIEVGLNPLAIALWKLAAREHDAIAAEVAMAKLQVKRLALWTKQEPDEEKRQKLAHDLKHALAIYEDRMNRLIGCEKVLNNATLRAGNNLDATVTVTRMVHPGVEIHIGADAKLVITKPLGRTTFRLKDGRVVWE